MNLHQTPLSTALAGQDTAFKSTHFRSPCNHASGWFNGPKRRRLAPKLCPLLLRLLALTFSQPVSPTSLFFPLVCPALPRAGCLSDRTACSHDALPSFSTAHHALFHGHFVRRSSAVPRTKPRLSSLTSGGPAQLHSPGRLRSPPHPLVAGPEPGAYQRAAHVPDLHLGRPGARERHRLAPGPEAMGC